MASKRSKERVGDILGLGDVASPSVPDTESTIGHQADEAHRRHHRMSEGADEVTPTATAPQRSSGATGIDMGSAGEGTDLE
jgi:hypothetical protein